MSFWTEKGDGWSIWFVPDGEGGTLAEWRKDAPEMDPDPRPCARIRAGKSPERLNPRDIHDAVLSEVVGDYEAAEA